MNRLIAATVGACLAATATLAATHYEHGGKLLSTGPQGVVIVWRSFEAMDRLAQMQSAGLKPTEGDIYQAIACIVPSGTAVSWLATNSGFPPSMRVIVREGPSKSCTGLVALQEFKADEP
jgi:hypothetical protein